LFFFESPLPPLLLLLIFLKHLPDLHFLLPHWVVVEIILPTTLYVKEFVFGVGHYLLVVAQFLLFLGLIMEEDLSAVSADIWFTF